MTERGHDHTSATVAVARKLVERTWTVLTEGRLYQLRDLDGGAHHRARGQGADRPAVHGGRRRARPRPGA